MSATSITRVTRAQAKLFYFLSHLLLYSLAEVAYLLGNLLPGTLAIGLWRLSLRWNRHHVLAALNIALVLAERNHPNAWAALLQAVQSIKNPWNTSGSDLFLTWVPGRIMRRLLHRVLCGRLVQAAVLNGAHDQMRQDALARLAEHHTRQALHQREAEHARQALDVWTSVAGNTLENRWAAVEVAILTNDPDTAEGIAHPLVLDGKFISPLETLRWARHFLTAGNKELAQRCLSWAQRWVPEVPDLWHLQGQLALSCGEKETALDYISRAVALCPENLDAHLDWLTLKQGWATKPQSAPIGRLDVSTASELTLQQTTTAICHLHGVPGQWTLHVLPPNGWGIVAEPRSKSFDAQGKAEIALRALRPDHIRGEAWQVQFVAVGPSGYLINRVSVRVPDPRPGRLLVAITEDHEIQEERDIFTPSAMQSLLVKKSAFASSMAHVPWTHMVEVGSTLFMPAEATQQDATAWQELWQSTRQHLVDEIEKGNDVQGHLHAFNDPQHASFPYRAVAQGWQTSLRFLLTEPNLRGDWASVCPPPGNSPYDRLYSAERTVAALESIGRLADPDYRPVLWRSGLLEYGESEADRAWSAVALRRAGLLADSDMSKPGSPVAGAVSPAFMANWLRPFVPDAGGSILQLPVVANLEGDYLMDSGLQRRRIKRTAAALRQPDGTLRPGVHLFTLLTHDKFINARASRDELRLDPQYGDWATIRQHIADWQQQGATFVTALDGVKAVLDERVWSLQTRLVSETFMAELGGEQHVRYRIELLGRHIPVSEDYPQHILVTVPPSIRPAVADLCAHQDLRALPVEWHREAGCAWLVLTQAATPVYCEFVLNQPVGPTVQHITRNDGNTWMVQFCAQHPFRRARVLLPWQALDKGYNPSKATWKVRDEAGQDLPYEACDEGLLLSSLRFSSIREQNAGQFSASVTLQALDT
jgi:hypothetical protein